MFLEEKGRLGRIIKQVIKNEIAQISYVFAKFSSNDFPKHDFQLYLLHFSRGHDLLCTLTLVVGELEVFPIEIVKDENVDKSNLINSSEPIISFPND